MKIPFIWLAIGFMIGIVLDSLFAIPGLWLLNALLFGMPLLWLSRGRTVFVILLVLIAAILGMFHVRLSLKRSGCAIEKLAGTGRVSVEGKVKTQPEVQIRGKRIKASFVLSTSRIVQQSASGREALETTGDIQVFLFQPSKIPQYGDRVKLVGQLEEPRGALNPGQFDYARYLRDRRISLVFRGYGKWSVRSLRPSRGPSLIKVLFQCRTWLSRRIDKIFQDSEAPFFKALITGERKEIRPELRDDFMKTGTSHLWAISGMNIALVAGSIYLVMILTGIGQRGAAAASLINVFVYVLIAGAGIPVQRAGWMAAAGFVSLIFERERNSLNIFFLALLILMLADPLSVRNVSFQLSFISVLTLILLMRQKDEMFQGWGNTFYQSLMVLVGTFPIVVYHFNIFSPISLLANAGAIPLFHLALLLALLALPVSFIPVMGLFVANTAGAFLKLGLLWIHLTASLKWGYWFLKTPSIGLLSIYYLALAMLVILREYPRLFSKPLKAIFAGLYFVAFGLFFIHSPSGDFSATFLAGGHNEMMHIAFDSHTHWLINAGRQTPSDQMQWIISPYLRSRGLKHLGGILLTDFYKKHTGGTDAFFRHFSTDYVGYPVLSREGTLFHQRMAKRRMNLLPLKTNSRLQLDSEKEIIVLAERKGQLALGIVCRSLKILFLPDLSPEMVELLKPHKNFLLETQIVFLPSIVKNPRETLDRLFDWTDPEAVITPAAQTEAQDYFWDRDIALLDLENYGAVTVNLPERTDKWKVGFETISYLKGTVRL